ncbi:histidine kinase [Pseudoflavitalea sp. G-6-1-2]|uniref:tetratricopeptide repeat-containing sensor histidine kinase n=1 Tax=Pseudoflavitalea sp. G-6-1-2 TaxID=2728841 RepID=UPI00146E0BF1|nr:histidine kinase [Pseudoflavitalea sp. G-6-1-2]NML24098.1 histidine kinase [Pseudoflavitalea sp. G-6-1-2]
MTLKHTRISLFIFALLALTTACHQQPPKDTSSNQKATSDSLIAFMKNNINPLFQEREYEASGKMLDSLQPLLENSGYYPITCTWLRFKGLQYMYEKKADSSEATLRKALAIAMAQDTSLAHVIAVKGNFIEFFINQKKLDSALIYASDAYYLSKKTGNSNLPAIVLKLAGIYSKIGDLDQWRKYLFEGMAISQEPRLKLAFATNIASYYNTIQEKDSALLFFRNFVEKDTTLNTPFFNSVKYENMGVMLSKQNRNEEALQYQLKAFQLSRQLGNLESLTLFNLGVTNQKLKQYDTAEKYFNEAYELALTENNKEMLTRIWRRKSIFYTELQRWQEAVDAKDSAYANFGREVDSSMTQAAREIETQYAVKAKDDEIRALAFSNEANRKISGQQKTIILILACSFLLAIILGIVLRRRRKLSDKLRQTELEQRLLRSQMEPHFIFNTLSVLQGFIRNSEGEKAVRYLNQFARLLRVTLENSRESFVPLEDEVAALENYLSLQAMRFEGLFDYTVDTWEMYDDEGLLIPPMLLQPFVENSILHGMKQLDQKGHIHISIQKEAHVLRCVIEDNGAGLQSCTIQPGKKSLSTTITQERLAILSRQTGYPAGISVANRKDEHQGTRVELSIPFRKARAFSGSGENASGF